jgi:Zn-dependent peptidase ImmA (M78 family)
MNDDAIQAVLTAKRLLHPELHRSLTWRGLQRVCARERVGLALRAMDEEAQLVCILGKATILVNSDLPARRHTYRAVHELAHLWLHVDPAEGRAATIYNFSGYDGDDPREAEAEFLASLILGGPRFGR